MSKPTLRPGKNGSHPNSRKSIWRRSRPPESTFQEKDWASARVEALLCLQNRGLPALREPSAQDSLVIPSARGRFLPDRCVPAWAPVRVRSALPWGRGRAARSHSSARVAATNPASRPRATGGPRTSGRCHSKLTECASYLESVVQSSYKTAEIVRIGDQLYSLCTNGISMEGPAFWAGR